MRSILQFYWILFFALLSTASFAQIRLPKLVSKGMVLQRNTDVKIWGWAAPNEDVAVEFNKKKYKAKADAQGTWSVSLAKMNAGGPYTMVLKASNEIKLDNILVGDVWLASGQSNMDLPMTRVKAIYESEIANSTNANIRFFTVKQVWDLSAAQFDFSTGEWREANPSNLATFSAVAYFFAKETFDKYKIPIGIIHSSLGGSPAEAWISEEAIKAFPVHYNEAQRLKDKSVVSKIEADDKAKNDEWYARARQYDEGYKNPAQKWSDPSFNTAGWSSFKVPGYYVQTALEKLIGVVWFRKEVEIQANQAGKTAVLHLGTIKDADVAFVNGIQVGTTSYQYPPRQYQIPENVLKAGKNVIVVRVVNNSFNGGFVPDKPYELMVGQEKIDLKGDWQYNLGTTMEPTPNQTSFRFKPTALYNAMLSPVLNYKIKGAIWYQGESNTGNPSEYKDLLATMIQDWRSRWAEGNFPFLIVQLANFMATKTEPTESNWAQLRDVQRRALSIPNTGLAVAIDLGEWNDIHPLNKKDVGKRLALSAQKVAYGDTKVVSSGPLYQSMAIDGNKINLTFSDTGSGLVAKGGGELKYFAIAGADKHYVWAKAKIENNKVVVWSDEVPNPVAVRYAWADNPAGANLYNQEGLPASPFSTDDK